MTGGTRCGPKVLFAMRSVHCRERAAEGAAGVAA
jgi:hypothetical protein